MSFKRYGYTVRLHTSPKTKDCVACDNTQSFFLNCKKEQDAKKHNKIEPDTACSHRCEECGAAKQIFWGNSVTSEAMNSWGDNDTWYLN